MWLEDTAEKLVKLLNKQVSNTLLDMRQGTVPYMLKPKIWNQTGHMCIIMFWKNMLSL